MNGIQFSNNTRDCIATMVPVTVGSLRQERPCSADSDVTHHELPPTLAPAQFILSVINKAVDDNNELYNGAQMPVTSREQQTLHQDMHNIGPGRRALTVFYAESDDLNANGGTDTIILPASRGGLPQP